MYVLTLPPVLDILGHQIDVQNSSNLTLRSTTTSPPSPNTTSESKHPLIPPEAQELLPFFLLGIVFLAIPLATSLLSMLRHYCSCCCLVKKRRNGFWRTFSKHTLLCKCLFNWTFFMTDKN